MTTDPRAGTPTPPTTVPPTTVPPTTAATSSGELIDGFQRGDERAARRLYQDYGGLVFGISRRTLGRRDLAEEATQETFLRAWRSAHRFDRSRPIAPWLTTIAKRVAIDIHRRESVRATSPLDEAMSAPSAVTSDTLLEDLDTVERVRLAVSMLKEHDAELIRLHHFEGLGYAEIGPRLGVPEGTVKSRSFRAHRRLVSLLADLRPATAAPMEAIA